MRELECVAWQVRTEADIYDDVDEATYQELVKKRREENFIEDDDGNGYVDFGQEDWDDAEYSGDESEQLAKRAKGNAARPKGVFNNLVPKPKKKATERVNGMFLGAGREVIGGAKAKVIIVRIKCLTWLQRDCVTHFWICKPYFVRR